MAELGWQASEAENKKVQAVREALFDAIRSNTRIKVPDFDRDAQWQGHEPPLRRIAQTPNPYGGPLGPFFYQFEGEDDLLHLFVVRADDAVITVEEARNVVHQLLPELPTALIWLKPGTYSQHFYFGHDAWLEAMT